MRKTILEKAVAAASGPREESYGMPWINLTNTAQLWTAYLDIVSSGKQITPTGGAEYVGAYELTAEDVAWLNVLQKVSRAATGTLHEDNYTDAAAYAAIAFECATQERDPQ